MATSLQIRNIPPELHERLKARAAKEGISMSRYVLRQIERALERPTRRELLDAIRSQPKVELDRPVADILREERDRR
ncbi:MAG: toxin-antitoxin system HicB family antitoxin [Alphaproteobacteria bacterium]|nr:toxin-antitoxin system HicB family antitoxin [Alphaproteobacteria bacterium]